MQTEHLIQNLVEQTRQILNQVEQLKSQKVDLIHRPAPGAWNILECLEHLNLYGDFYFAEIEKAIKTSGTKPEAEFSSGMLGAYFSKMILPKNKLNKMKTLKNKNPFNTSLDRTVLDRFVNQQLKLIELLIQSRSVSLNKIKIRTAFSGVVKLKLGDTFQFIINHNLRHLQQIKNIQAQLSKSLVEAHA